MWETPLLSSPRKSPFWATTEVHSQRLGAPLLPKSPRKGELLTRRQQGRDPLRPFSPGKSRAGPCRGPPPRRRDGCSGADAACPQPNGKGTARHGAAATNRLRAPPHRRQPARGLTFRTPPKPCSAATRSASAWPPPRSSTKKWLV